MRWVWHVAHEGEKRSAYRVLVEKPEGKKPLVTPRHRVADNIQTGFSKKRWDDVDWINLA